MTVALGGTTPGAYRINGNTCTGSIGALGNCDVGVQFQPTAMGAAPATLDVSGMPGGALSFGLAGNGIPPATLAISPGTHSFGRVTLGAASTAQTFTVRNTGGTTSGPVNVSLSGTNGSEFILSNNTCLAALAPNATCTFDLQLGAASAGMKSATVTAAATPGGSAPATLSGDALTPASLSGAGTGSFASTVINLDSTPITFTFTNSGESATPPLTVGISGTHAGDFVKGADTCVGQNLAGGNGMCTVTITFHPTATGSRAGTLTVGAAGLLPVIIPLGGVGLTAASLSMSPMGNVSFGDVATNGSQTITFGITNTGQGTSGMVTVSVTGAGFAVMTNTCSGTLAANANCDVVVQFSPGTLGGKTGTLQVSASPGGMQSANLSGTGVAPGALEVTPATFDFGNVVQGSSGQQLFTVRNTGTAATTIPAVTLVGSGQGFSQTTTCSSALASMATCTVTVTFAPAMNGPRGQQSILLQVSATIGGTDSSSLTGTAQTPAALSISPPAFTFPDTTVGVTSPTTALITVTNTGDQTTPALSLLPPSGGEFTVRAGASDQCTGVMVLGGAQCTFIAQFTPGQSGARSGMMTVSMGGSFGNVSSALSGNGLSPASLSWSGSGAFGNVVIPNTSARTITLTNGGQSPSGVIGFSVTGDFSINFGASTCPASAPLAANSSCTLSVVFTARSPAGSKTGVLTATATPGGSPTLNLTGTSQNAAVLTPGTSSNDFGQVEVSTVGPTSFPWTLTNTGDVATATLTTSVPSPFIVISDSCNAMALAAMSSCTVRVGFSPTAAGNVMATATVSGTGVSATATLSGIGAWRLTVTPTNLGVVDSFDGRIVNCTPATTTQCSALYATGSMPTLRARTSNNGAHFAAWSSPAVCAAYGVGQVCTIPMTASTTAAPIFSGTSLNLAFVTSGVVPGFLGGLAPYDAYCNISASDAGINNAGNNAYVAWMSANSISAATRITTTGGWVRVDNNMVALNETDLLASRIRYPLHLDEFGREIPGNDAVWTGTTAAGVNNGFDCAGWTADAGALFRGLPNGGPGFWTDGTGGHTCNNAGTRIYCLQNTIAGAPTMPAIPTSGRRVFRSNPVGMPAGRSGANAACSAQAAAAGHPGTYAAMLATTTLSAGSVLNDTTVYFRIDGARLGTGAEIKAQVMATGIWQLPDGGYPLPSAGETIWTGSTANINLASDNQSTCNNWDGGSGATVRLGKSPVASPNFMDSFGLGAACGNMHGLYCVQQ